MSDRTTPYKNAEDFSGIKFGLWEVLYPTGDRRRGYVVWWCRCVCGHKSGLDSLAIKQRRPHSCGCVTLKCGVPRKPDLSGTAINRISVLHSIEPGVVNTNWRAVYYQCRCVCGREWPVCGRDLRAGRIRSCGCLNKTLISASRTTHGKSYSRVYRIWASMIQRCTQPSNDGWAMYGGRGVTVATQWQASFEQFLTDVGEPPTKFHSLDRYPDPNGNYEPGNTRWATRRQQANNRRNTTKLVYGGVERALAEWADYFGVVYATFRWWYKEHGADEAFRRAEQRMRDRQEHPDAFAAECVASATPGADQPTRGGSPVAGTSDSRPGVG